LRDWLEKTVTVSKLQNKIEYKISSLILHLNLKFKVRNKIDSCLKHKKTYAKYYAVA
jgi:hypothetical protein